MLRLRDVLPLLLVLAWGVAAPALLLFAMLEPHRDAALAALSALACLALSVMAWKPGPRPWGALPLVALSVVPLLMALWWGSPWAPFVALPAAAILALQPAARAPTLPAQRGRAAVVLLACYLALAPPLDALAFGPPEPPALQVAADGVDVGPVRSQRLAGGGGAVWEQQATQGGLPAIGLVRATLAATENASDALRSGYAPGREEGAVVFWPFPFFLHTEERRAAAAPLPEGWVRTAVIQENLTVFFMIPIPMSEGHRQLLLLKPTASVATPSLLPPFGIAWTQYAGYHVFEEGDNAAALRALDGRVLAAGQALELPSGAYDDLDVGPLRPVPALGTLAALAAAGVAARLRCR